MSAARTAIGADRLPKRGGWRAYAFAVGAVAIAVGLRWMLDPWVGDNFPFITAFAAVAVAVWGGGYRPALLATVLGYLACAYFFVAPRGSVTFDRSSDYVGAIAFLFTNSLIIGIGEAMRTAQRRAVESKQSLRDSEQRFRLLADAAPVLIWISGTDKLCTWFNQGWLDFVGRSMEQEVGNGWTDNVHPEDVARCVEIYTTSFDARQSFTMEYRLRHRDGEYRWVLDHGIPLYGDGGAFSGYVGSCIDIAERKEAEEGVAHSERRQRFIAEALGALVERDEPDRALQTVFQQAREYLGAEIFINYIVGADNDSLVLHSHSGISAEQAAAMQRLAFGQSICGTVAQSGKRIVAADIQSSIDDKAALARQMGVQAYACMPLDAAGQVLGTVSFGTRNRTEFSPDEVEFIGVIAGYVSVALERVLQADATRRSQDRLAGLVDAAMDAIVSVDEEQRITLFNPAAERMFGYSAAEVLGRSIAPLIPGRFREVHASHIRSFATTGITSRAMGALGTVRGLRRNGEEFPIEAAISQVDTGNQKIFTVVLRDITERRRLEDERRALLEGERAARAQAEQASRLKDEFLATLSHELRTPLHAILGWSRLMQSKRLDPKTIDDGIQVITRNAKAQADLIADLLDMSRIVSGKFRLEMGEVNLADLVTAQIDAIRQGADAKEIRIRPTIDAHLGTIPGDSSRLQQVVWNLLSNALKFTPKGGCIDVGLAKKDGCVEITVADTGSGMDPEFLQHLFERFRQADGSTTRAHGGLGLGLAIVKHIVELHGGTVRAESAGRGRGATFTIELPLSAKRGAATDPSWPDVDRTRRRSLASAVDFDLSGTTILAIDDEADIRELLSRVLQECRARVLCAASADDALISLEVCRPDVVLCDIGMPEKDGYAFIEQLRSRGDDTPAIAVTAFARSEDRQRAFQAGYQGHVAKPVEPAELVAAIATLAKRTSALRQPTA